MTFLIIFYIIATILVLSGDDYNAKVIIFLPIIFFGWILFLAFLGRNLEDLFSLVNKRHIFIFLALVIITLILYFS